MSDDSERSQLRFVDGNLVEPVAVEKDTDSDPSADVIEPGDHTGFTIEVKSGALEVNEQLRKVGETHGETLDFGSRQEAEDYADQLSTSDGGLRVQGVPENEPKNVDAYFLADHNPSITDPAEINGGMWTFDVGANLYGALGEAILLYTPKPHALVYFVRQDLDIDDDKLEWGLNVDVDRGQLLAVEDAGETKRWSPDCVIKAKDGCSGALLERYYCEIKTGNASFERSQVEAMEALATDERVLKIRVRIENLPDQYSLRIHEVEPPA